MNANLYQIYCLALGNYFFFLMLIFGELLLTIHCKILRPSQNVIRFSHRIFLACLKGEKKLPKKAENVIFVNFTIIFGEFETRLEDVFVNICISKADIISEIRRCTAFPKA